MKDSLSQIAAEVSSCKKCPLYKGTCNGVPGAGNPKARIMFIGEAPGASEDETGLPFVGRSGKHLTRELERIGLSRDAVFITSVCKHRPPENRPPTKEEIQACQPYLTRQLTLINPKIVVLLGKSAQSLLEHDILAGRTVRLIVHPSAAMRFTKMQERFRASFDELKTLL